MDIYNINFGEEFNFYGFFNDILSVLFGVNYGYLGCFFIYDFFVVWDYFGGVMVG